MAIWFYEDCFIVGIDHKTSLAFVGLFDKFPLAIIHGNLIAALSFGVIRANFSGV